MYVIGHDYISQKQKPARLLGLIKSFAGDRFDGVSSKYRKSIFGDCRDEETRRISGDPESL
jgi:hypothetical protein